MKLVAPVRLFFAVRLHLAHSVGWLRQGSQTLSAPRALHTLSRAVQAQDGHNVQVQQVVLTDLQTRKTTNSSNGSTMINAEAVTAQRIESISISGDAGDGEFVKILQKAYGKRYYEGRLGAYGWSKKEQEQWQKIPGHRYESNGELEGATYGEILPDGIRKLLQDPRIKAKPKEKFYDLGSGDGKAVMVAWLMGLQATGLELVEKRFKESCRALREVEKLQKPSNASSVMRFYRASFTEFSFADADILYTANWAFNDDVQERVATAAKQLKKGSFVIAFHPFETKDFVTLGTIRMPVTWDDDPYEMTIQRKVTESATPVDPLHSLTGVPAGDTCEL